MEANAGHPLACPVSDVDLWSDEILADPYPAFKGLQERGPVVWLERQDLGAFPRYAEVNSALRNWQVFSSAAGAGIDAAANDGPENIVASDPPSHTEHRRLLATQLSRQALAGESAQIAQTAESLAAEAVSRGSFEAVADLARPLSISVVCDMLGVSSEDDHDFLPELGERAFNLFGPDGQRLGQAPAALGEFDAYIQKLAASGQIRPGTKGAEIVATGEAGYMLSYLWPGIDTTINAIASAIYLFARHPEHGTSSGAILR